MSIPLKVTAYHALIGDAPDCGPGDHDTARRYLAKIEDALDRGDWDATSRGRLNQLKLKWRARSAGEDPRFEIVGTHGGKGGGGRLPRDIEHEIDVERKRIKAKQNVNKRMRDKRRRPPPIEDYDDPVLRDTLRDPDVLAGSAYTGDADSGGGERPAGWRRSGSPDEEYFVAASDSRGHNERVQLRVQPRHAVALQRIKEEKRFPFETVSDVVRWCIDKGVEELNRRQPSATVGSVLQQARIIQNFMLDEKRAQDYEDAFNEIRNTISRYLSAQAKGEARRVVARTKHDIEQMPEGYWRDKYLTTLRREFGELLDADGANVVSFVGSEGDESIDVTGEQ